MKYPLISEYMKDQRKEVGKTIYTLAEQVGVTASYLSQVENGNKLPSKNVMLKITHWLDKYFIPNDFNRNILTAYSGYKGIDPNNLIDQYQDFRVQYVDEVTKDITGHIEAISRNSLKVSKNKWDEKGEVLEEPYFDLEYLLTQNKYELFYGRKYDIQNSLQDETAHPRNRTLYSRLNDEDIRIIHKMVEAYISERYKKAHMTE